MKNALVMEKLSITYRTRKQVIPVIENLSLRIEQGEVLAVLGSSGCGKTTLINALAGVHQPDGGSVDMVRGSERSPLHPGRQKIAVIPQTYGLLPWKTVRANCLLPLKLHREPISEALEREIGHIWEVLDIRHLQGRYPHELSGGQAQCVAVARAFILKPDLLLMDEPFSALDAITRQEAWKLFLRVWKQNRSITILVTHNIEEALYLGSTIAVMEAPRGRLVHTMRNPFFGEAGLSSPEYHEVKQLLQDRLKPAAGKAGKR